MAIRVPGIIVRIVNDTGLIAPPLFERFPVIIGEGDPYRLVSNSAIVRGAGNTDALPTVSTVNEIVSVGDLPGIAGYVAGTDYSLVGNTISWAGAATQPTAADTYYVTFTETRPASAYSPMLYLDENLIYADHGNSTRTDGTINDVAVGGSLALNAGSNGVIIAQLDLSGAVDPDNPTNTELETAFIAMRDALNKITDYKLFLIPMSSGTLNTTSAANIFFNHAVLASQPERKQERTVIAALTMGTTYQAAATFAQSYAHERMVVPAVPDTTVQVVGFDGDYDMRFYNAVLGGKLCSVNIGIEISDEILPNILFTDNYTPDEANYLVQRGVSPGKIRGEVVRNIMAITTDTTNALTESLGVQDIKDYVKKYWRDGLWNIFRNKPINTTLLSNIHTASTSILNSLVSRAIVADFRNISVSQNVTEPRKVDVTGQIQPAFGLQWMDVTFTFVLSFAA
jgi:hypothetical protein